MAGNKEEIKSKALREARDFLLSPEAGTVAFDERVKDWAARRKKIEEVAKDKHPLVNEYMKLHKDAEMKSFTRIGRLANEMKLASTYQRRLKLAAEICQDPEVKEELEKEYQESFASPIWDSYEKYIKGLEYLAGITTELDPEVKHFFKHELCEVLPDDKESIYEKCRTGEVDKNTGASGKEYDDQLDEYTKGVNLEYQKRLAPVKARELFAKNLAKTHYLEVQFLGEGTMDKMPINTHFIKRMTPAAFCFAKMVLKGYSLERILDPQELVKEKKLIGQEYLDLYKKNDVATYVDEMYKATGALIDAFDRYVKEHKDELKTEQDLAMHANMLGIVSYVCMDLSQELQRTRNHSKTVSINAINDRIVELGKRDVGLGVAETALIQYNIDTLNSQTVAKEVTRQLRIKMLLEEIKKDEPDFNNNLLTDEEWTDAINQLGTIDELAELFDGDAIDLDKVELNEINVLVSMMNNDFVNQNKIRYESPRVPVKVTKAPEVCKAGEIEEGKKFAKLVTRDGKQLVQTTLTMDKELKKLEKKDLRGKTSGNSKEFNALLESYDVTIENLGNSDLSDRAFLNAMQPLKEAAEQYIRAKREQKGYKDKDVPKIDIDNSMMGNGKGASIFTSRGKARYKFAMQIVLKITEMEKAIQEKEMKEQLKKQHKLEKVIVKPDTNLQKTEQVVNQEPMKQSVQKEETKPVKMQEEKVEKPSYAPEVIEKAKELLSPMETFIEDYGDLSGAFEMSEVAQIDPAAVPKDFIVDELKIMSENEFSKASISAIVNILKYVAAAEKTNDNDKEMEDDFSL